MIISMLHLDENETARVVKIEGGMGIQKKFESMGLRLGVKVKKLSSSVFGGPVVIKCGRTVIALGKGIVNKIIVEVKE